MPLPWTTIFSDRTDADGDFNPCSGWMKAEDVGRMRATFDVRDTTDASGVIKLGYQTANVENAPDAAVVPSAPLNSQTGDGMSYPTGLLAGVLEFEDCA
jgi:hypothetical protein